MTKQQFFTWLRGLGMAEGVSYLLLLGVAMPLKYWANMPQAVSVVGMLHGVLFVAFLAGLYYCWQAYSLPLKTAAWGAICAILPFGPFLFDQKLRQAMGDRQG
jgi:integral membrane protein